MKIALTYPSISESGFNTEKKPAIFNNIHPGLCYLSAACKRSGFNDISLIDLRVLYGWDDLKNRIEELKPDVAGITLMSPDYKHALKCIDIIKSVSSNIVTVVGGYHPTIMTEEMATNDKIDHVVAGGGEGAVPNLF